jgi:hypothetical protein
MTCSNIYRKAPPLEVREGQDILEMAIYEDIDLPGSPLDNRPVSKAHVAC